jgi:uncharacterized protein with HEPN domain
MKDDLGDKARLHHILDAISEIQVYTEDIELEEFSTDSMRKYATIKQLEIIGEAANHTSEEIKKTNSEIKWGEIIGLRNILIHQYFGIDENVLWEIVKEDIPVFKKQVSRILNELE